MTADENDIITAGFCGIVAVALFLLWGYVYFGGAVNIQNNNWLLGLFYFLGFVWMVVWVFLFGTAVMIGMGSV